jgi:hypothetical protein
VAVGPRCPAGSYSAWARTRSRLGAALGGRSTIASATKGGSIEATSLSDEPLEQRVRKEAEQVDDREFVRDLPLQRVDRHQLDVLARHKPRLRSMIP